MPLYGFDAVNVNTASSAAFADKTQRIALVKSTEGQGWKNTAYPALKKLARDNNKLFGAYHYAWTVQDPVLEAANFVGYSALEPGDVAVLDIERQAEMPPMSDTAAWKAWWQQVNSFSITWLTEVRKALNVKPFIYVNGSWRNNMLAHATLEQKEFLVSHPQWFADPGANNTAKTPGHFNQTMEWGVDIHQYHFLTGIDKNWYAHSEEQWQALTIPKPPVVVPAPVPTDLDKILAAIRAQDTEISAVKASVLLVNDGIDDVLGVVGDADLKLASINDSLTSQAVAIEEVDIKVDSVLANTEQTVEDINTLFSAIDGHYLNLGKTIAGGFAELKTQNDALPANMANAVDEALSGFSLTVSYPKRSV